MVVPHRILRTNRQNQEGTTKRKSCFSTHSIARGWIFTYICCKQIAKPKRKKTANTWRRRHVPLATMTAERDCGKRPAGRRHTWQLCGAFPLGVFHTCLSSNTHTYAGRAGDGSAKPWEPDTPTCSSLRRAERAQRARRACHRAAAATVELEPGLEEQVARQRPARDGRLQNIRGPHR